MSEAKVCGNCRHAQSKSATKVECHRHAPPVTTPEDNVTTKPKAVWPLCKIEDWCSEWQKGVPR